MNGAVVTFSGYTLLLAGIGIWSFKILKKIPLERYEQEFYAAGRGLGGIVIALLIAGGLASAGTFIAGPGMNYAYGFSWMYFNNFMIFMNLMLLAPIGIIIGMVARRINAVTYLDIIKARYQSRTLVFLLAGLVALFLIPYMSSQFVGAARCIAQMTGLSYGTALILGAGVVGVYCVMGGMRGTSLAILVQGVVITAGCLILFAGTVQSAGGVKRATEILAVQNQDFLSPTMGGAFPPAFALSMACILGYFIVGLPHAMLGALTYKNTASLKRGIWMGSIILFVWAVPLSISGILGRAINPRLSVPDDISPWLAMNVIPEALGGIVLAGIVAGIQTTVAAMAIIITSGIARNVLKEIKPDISGRGIQRASRWTMALCIGIAIALAVLRPALIQWVIIFSVGGLEATTFATILIGLFWKRANKWGAISSILWGTLLYGIASTVAPRLNPFGMHPTVIALATSVVVFVGVSLCTPPPEASIKALFWGPDHSDAPSG